MLVYQGEGVLNSLINKLPVELHIPGYQYCGPGTKLQKRLARGDPGINPLDAACKQHDIAYSQNKYLEECHKADQILKNVAWERVKSKDASVGEKAVAWFLTTEMNGKLKLGMGVKKPAVSFRRGIVEKIAKSFKPTSTLTKSAANAWKVARKAVKKVGGRRRVKVPRIIPIAKSGGILLLIPIFTAVGALGSFAGGASAIAKSAIDAKNAQKKFDEDQRHNKAMEAVGKGLYLRKNAKGGFGLFLKQKN